MRVLAERRELMGGAGGVAVARGGWRFLTRALTAGWMGLGLDGWTC
jgi:hypothetical protein